MDQNKRHSRRGVVLGLLATPIAIAGCSSVIESISGPAATRAVNDRRRLTIGLWGGGDQDAADELPTLEEVGGRDNDRFIRGPFPWSDPVSGRSYMVYERLRETDAGPRRQLLTVTHGGQALGRVFDHRPGQPDRRFEDDAIFPLGIWERGEQRTFLALEHTVDGTLQRRQTLRIRRLDFTFRDQPNSLRYDWIATDLDGRPVFEERYEYSPGAGLVGFTDRLT